jgi:hypothetical protein
MRKTLKTDMIQVITVYIIHQIVNIIVAYSNMKTPDSTVSDQIKKLLREMKCGTYEELNILHTDFILQLSQLPPKKLPLIVSEHFPDCIGSIVCGYITLPVDVILTSIYIGYISLIQVLSDDDEMPECSCIDGVSNGSCPIHNYFQFI